MYLPEMIHDKSNIKQMSGKGTQIECANYDEKPLVKVALNFSTCYEYYRNIINSFNITHKYLTNEVTQLITYDKLTN
jgi:hypothetical protein